MNLRFLETFIWVAKLGSFRAAANQLHLTQAAISGRIASLESELDQLLFERSSRNIQLTSAGYRLLRFSNQVLQLERDLLADFQGELVLRGRVRLGIVESIVHTWFNSFVSALHRIHPDVELELTVEPSRRLSDLLRQGLLDVALQTDPILTEGVRNVPVGSLKMGFIVAAGNEPKVAVDIKALTDQWAIVTFPRNSQPHLALMEVLETANVVQPRIHFVSSIAASMQLMAAGICVGAVPLAAYRQGLSDGRFVNVPCTSEIPDLRLVASWRHDSASGLGEAVVKVALDEMHAYASKYSDATAPLDTSVFLI